MQVLQGVPWPVIEADGLQPRSLWASFARDEQLPERGSIAGVVNYARS